jgi:hypothetical protein
VQRERLDAFRDRGPGSANCCVGEDSLERCVTLFMRGCIASSALASAAGRGLTTDENKLGLYRQCVDARRGDETGQSTCAAALLIQPVVLSFGTPMPLMGIEYSSAFGGRLRRRRTAVPPLAGAFVVPNRNKLPRSALDRHGRRTREAGTRKPNFRIGKINRPNLFEAGESQERRSVLWALGKIGAPRSKP